MSKTTFDDWNDPSEAPYVALFQQKIPAHIYSIYKNLFPEFSEAQIDCLIKEFGGLSESNPHSVPFEVIKDENGHVLIVAYNYSKNSVEMIEHRFEEGSDGLLGRYANYHTEVMDRSDVVSKYWVKAIEFMQLAEKYSKEAILESFIQNAHYSGFSEQ